MASEFTKVSNVQKLKRMGGRECVEVAGRSISLFYAVNNGVNCVFAMDSRCYHTGGPLWEGAIEDIGRKAYVICPWHKYVIRLEDGISVLKGPKLVEKGVRQRTHEVKINDNGEIMVKLSKMPGEEEIPSDHYCPATDEEKRRMGLLK